MTLLTAAIAAVIVTLVWYFKYGTNEMRIGTLSLMYWGATPVSYTHLGGGSIQG